MKNKMTITVLSTLFSMTIMQASSSMANSGSINSTFKSVKPISINKNKQPNAVNKKKFIKEKELDNGVYTYIVRLKDLPIATYDGSINNLTATNPRITKKNLFKTLVNSKKSSQEIRKELKLDLKSPAAIAYSNYLETKQKSFLNNAKSKIGNELKVIYKYKNTINGLAVSLTQAEAEKLSTLSSVAFIERERMESLHTDTGPIHIGATAVWEGEGQSAVNMGEGVIIGVVDTGINSDHPSFADVGGDGYDHTNPWGEGVYVGDCAGDFANLCNDKLIGIYSYPSVTDSYDDTAVYGDTPPAKNGEDYNGHGSHTASTSGGNILIDVPLLDPETGVEEGDGVNTSGFEFDRISGVAPHANIISYQICHPGNNGDTYSGCPGSAIIAALEDAVEDGVDVINYSISGGQNPWDNASEIAFLSAQEAGVFASVSAGNSGPDANTTDKSAPWYTAVGASTHGREVAFDKTIGSFTGGNSEIEDMNGSSASGGITAKIVWAGDYTNPNDPDGDPEQCLEPFPEDTFSGEIVVCDRGAIARVQKAINVRDGGAAGFVLANIDDGATSLNDDAYVIPGIHINNTDGNTLRAWLAEGSDHMATITAATGQLQVTPENADIMADFSSRGPNSFVDDIMTPSVTAPGVSIYAAYADQQFGHDQTSPSPSDYAFLQGTSMSAPHVAGAGAILKSAHPTWTPDNIRSALMLTAVTDVKKEDGTTPADVFDMGSGSIRVNLAHQTGLIMNETAANYLAANPANGGDPKTLNIPSVSNANCVGVCDWTRTVTATSAGTWTVEGVSISTGLKITTSPATFTLAAGESQQITINVDAIEAQSNAWAFGHVVMTSESHPTARIPVSVLASNGNIPNQISFEANRNVDSAMLKDVMAVEISAFTSRSYGLTKADINENSLAVDSDNSSIFDDLEDGINITMVEVPEGAKRFVAEIIASESPDLDLFVGIDSNDDGIPQEDELITFSATATALEQVDLMLPDAGKYWIIIQNWQASAEGAEDAYSLATAIVNGELGENLSVEADASIPALTEFDILFKWWLDDEAAYGDRYYGAIDIGTSAETAGNLGLVAVNLMRGMDDVSISSNAEAYMDRTDTVDYQISVLPKRTPNDRTYSITATIPEGMTLDADSVSAGGVVFENEITWVITQESLFGLTPFYTMTSNENDASCALPNFGQGGTYIDLASFGITPGIMEGNDQVVSYGISSNFLGEAHDALHVTDDGFIFMSGSVGSSPWSNQLLPNSDEANNLIAPMWRDGHVIKSATSGVSVATAAQFAIIEFDDMQHWLGVNGHPSGIAPGDIQDVMDFEVVINRDTGDFMFAYDNVTHHWGSSLGATVGYEDAAGENGLTTIYQTSIWGGEDGSVSSVEAITDGLIYCYTLTAVDSDPALLTFSTQINEDFIGGPVNVQLTHETADDDTVTVTDSHSVAIQVEGVPVASIVANASEVLEGRAISLDASSSTDPNNDPLTYAWVQLSGTEISFDATASMINFDAPAIESDETLSFQVTVNDGKGNMDQANVSITVKASLPPTAVISGSTSITEGASVQLSGVNSSDPEGETLTYTWQQTSGTSVSFDSSASSISFIAPDASSNSMSFQLTVDDGYGNTDSTTISISIKEKPSTGGGSFGWLLLLMPLVLLRRKKLH